MTCFAYADQNRCYDCDIQRKGCTYDPAKLAAYLEKRNAAADKAREGPPTKGKSAKAKGKGKSKAEGDMPPPSTTTLLSTGSTSTQDTTRSI